MLHDHGIMPYSLLYVYTGTVWKATFIYIYITFCVKNWMFQFVYLHGVVCSLDHTASLILQFVPLIVMLCFFMVTCGNNFLERISFPLSLLLNDKVLWSLFCQEQGCCDHRFYVMYIPVLELNSQHTRPWHSCTLFVLDNAIYMCACFTILC